MSGCSDTSSPGFDRTQVCVVADRYLTRNTHEIVAEGTFGELRLEIRNVPTDANPRTGRLDAVRIVSALRRRNAALLIG